MARSRFGDLLKAKIEEATANKVQAMVAGVPDDYPAYREMVGYLKGMSDAVKLVDETDTEMSQ